MEVHGVCCLVCVVCAWVAGLPEFWSNDAHMFLHSLQVGMDSRNFVFTILVCFYGAVA